MLKEMFVRIGVKVGEYFYFVSAWDNILFSFHIANGKIESVASFTDGDIKGIELFASMIEDKNKLYLVPRNGSYMAIYDLEKRRSEKIDIRALLTQKKGEINHFFSATFINSCIYFIPGMNRRIGRFRLDDMMLDNSITVKTGSIMYPPYFCSVPCLWEGKAILTNIYAELEGFYYTFLDMETQKMNLMVPCKTKQGYAACGLVGNSLVGMYRDGRIDVWNLKKEYFEFSSGGEHGEELYYRSLYIAKDFTYSFSTQTGTIIIYKLSEYQYNEQILPYGGYTCICQIDKERVLAAARNNKFILLSFLHGRVFVEKEYDFSNYYCRYVISETGEILGESNNFALKSFCEVMKQDTPLSQKNDSIKNKVGSRIFAKLS